MKPHLNVLIPGDLLEALDAFAAEWGANRSEITRLAIWRLLNAPEPYVAPALPNWQTEAWTALLRGLFGDARLVLTDEIEALLREAVAVLNEREIQVLNLRFGLNGPRYTLKEVAAAMGITRERVRQVEARALRRLRHPGRSRKIWKLLKRQLVDD